MTTVTYHRPFVKQQNNPTLFLFGPLIKSGCIPMGSSSSICACRRETRECSTTISAWLGSRPIIRPPSGIAKRAPESWPTWGMLGARGVPCPEVVAVNVLVSRPTTLDRSGAIGQAVAGIVRSSSAVRLSADRGVVASGGVARGQATGAASASRRWSAGGA